MSAARSCLPPACSGSRSIHGWGSPATVFEHFEGETYRDPEVLKLLARIEARPHAHQPKGMYEHFQGEVIVTTTGGTRYSARVDQPLRGPKNSAPPDRLESKFKDCAAKSLEASAIGRVYEMLQTFENLSDVRQAAKLMAASVKTKRIECAAA